MKDFFGWMFVALVLSSVFGLSLYWQAKKDEQENPASYRAETAVEIWTDEVTGHRFAIAKHKWKDGIGICLIPSFRADTSETEDMEVPEPKILDSRADVSFERR